jgi:hypothetical protein
MGADPRIPSSPGSPAPNRAGYTTARHLHTSPNLLQRGALYMTDVTPEYPEACRSYLEQFCLVHTYPHTINQSGRLNGLKTKYSQSWVLRPISKVHRTPKPALVEMNPRQNGRDNITLATARRGLHHDSHLFTAPSRQTAARMEAIMLGSTWIYPLHLNYAERLPHRGVLSNTRADR